MAYINFDAIFEFLGQFTIRCIEYFSKRCWYLWDRAQSMLILELFGVGGGVPPEVLLFPIYVFIIFHYDHTISDLLETGTELRAQ